MSQFAVMAILVTVVVALILLMVFDVVRQRREGDETQPAAGIRWTALARVALIAVRRRVVYRP